MTSQVLTERQTAVLRFLAKGGSDSRILQDTGLSMGEFDDLVKQLFSRLGVSSRVELILFAYCEPACLRGGKTNTKRSSVEQSDGTAQKTTLSDAATHNVKAARKWAA